MAISYFAEGVQAEREIGLVYRSSSTRSVEFLRLGELVTSAFRAAVAEQEPVRSEAVVK